jgi:hypothetical protein
MQDELHCEDCYGIISKKGVDSRYQNEFKCGKCNRMYRDNCIVTEFSDCRDINIMIDAYSEDWKHNSTPYEKWQKLTQFGYVNCTEHPDFHDHRSGTVKYRRIKELPKINVNGWFVEDGQRDGFREGSIFYIANMNPNFYTTLKYEHSSLFYIENGLAYPTREQAIKRSKASMNLDPTK